MTLKLKNNNDSEYEFSFVDSNNSIDVPGNIKKLKYSYFDNNNIELYLFSRQFEKGSAYLFKDIKLYYCRQQNAVEILRFKEAIKQAIVYKSILELNEDSMINTEVSLKA